MTIITGQVYCPLCEKPFRCHVIQIHQKRANLYTCSPCKIGIYDFDPAFNKWRDADKIIPCPNPQCNGRPVKWFARYIDGFFVGRCPKCKIEFRKDGDVKFGKGGNIIIPEDMEQEAVEKPVEVKIPLTHFIKKFGKDKINAIAKRIKLRREQSNNG